MGSREINDQNLLNSTTNPFIVIIIFFSGPPWASMVFFNDLQELFMLNLTFSILFRW